MPTVALEEVGRGRRWLGLPPPLEVRVVAPEAGQETPMQTMPILVALSPVLVAGLPTEEVLVQVLGVKWLFDGNFEGDNYVGKN